MGIKVVILAAGKGQRMTSTLPKVLHLIGGKPMLQHVVDTAYSIEPEEVFVVYGAGGDQLRRALPSLNVTWIEQKEQLGTGHAVRQVLPHLKTEDQVLVLYGDVPLISVRLLKQLLLDTPHGGLGLVVTELANATGFGRIIRNEVGNIVAIVEHKDAKDWQLDIREVNTGIIASPACFLLEHLGELKNQNSQKEYYLTDMVSLAVEHGLPVGGVLAHQPEEVLGVNDRWQQAKLERFYQRKQAKKLALLGVRIADFNRIDVRGELSIGMDSFVDINAVFEGNVKVGRNCIIGPNVTLKNTTIGDNVTVLACSHIEGARIESNATIGPFARLRPGTLIADGAKAGNFVEIKNAELGVNSKVNHLSYIGDALIEKDVNIGAGTITCNYDGVNKHKTHIASNAFVGSNTSLVAPITIGKNATVAAGSTVTKNVPSDKLVIERSSQQVVEGWTRPSKQTNKV